MRDKKEIAYKFVNHDTGLLEDLKDTREYILKVKVNKGEELTVEEKEWIFIRLQSNHSSKKGIPVMGYLFDFSMILKTYWIKSEYEEEEEEEEEGNFNIEEVYAIDENSVLSFYRDVTKIVEVK